MIPTFLCLGLFVLAVLAYGMLRKKKEIAPIILLAVYSVFLAVVQETVSELRQSYLARGVLYLLLALLCWLVINRLSADLLIKVSIPIYVVTVLFLVLCNFLPTYGYYVRLGSVVLEPAKLLMFSVLPVSYLISRKQEIRIGTVFLISLMLLVELGAAAMISNYRIVVVVFFVFLALLYKGKIEKRLHISWLFPVGLSGLFVLGYFGSFLFSDRMQDRLKMLLSGGMTDPNGMGFFPRVVRAALGESRLLGASDATVNGSSAVEWLANSGYYPTVTGIMNYGWIFFLLLLAAEIFLIYRLFRMSSKVKNTYARYVIFSIAVYFALTTFFALMGEFSGLGASFSLPFLGRGTSQMIEGILLGIASLLYAQRKKITYGAQLDVDYDFTGNALQYFMDKYRAKRDEDPDQPVYRQRLVKLEEDRALFAENKISDESLFEDISLYHRETVQTSPESDRVFISYNTGDGLIVRYLAKELEKRGLKPWYCEADVKEYRGSCAYADAIMDALGKTEIFIVVLTPRAAESKHVLNEVAIAFDAEKMIYPVMVEDFNLVEKKSMWYYLVRQDVRRAIPPETKRKLRELADSIAAKTR